MTTETKRRGRKPKIEQLDKAIEEMNEVVSKPVKGDVNLVVFYKDERLDEISESYLEQYCRVKGLDFYACKDIIGHTWVNHNGYSFKLI